MQTLDQEGHSHTQRQFGVSRWHWLPMFLKVKRDPASMLNRKKKIMKLMDSTDVAEHPIFITHCAKMCVKT